MNSSMLWSIGFYLPGFECQNILFNKGKYNMAMDIYDGSMDSFIHVENYN